MFFRQSNGKLWTNILYYSDDSIHTIGEECIRGIDGVDRRNKQHIRERCSMDILFRDGIVRGMMLFAHERPTKVFGIRSIQRGGLIIRWRLPRAGDDWRRLSTHYEH